MQVLNPAAPMRPLRIANFSSCIISFQELYILTRYTRIIKVRPSKVSLKINWSSITQKLNKSRIGKGHATVKIVK